MTDDLQYGTLGHGVEREQDERYQAFLKEREPAKKIQLGNDFLRKYPKSPLAERVDADLVNVYRAQQDWKDCYQSADSALALSPMMWTFSRPWAGRSRTCTIQAIRTLIKN